MQVEPNSAPNPIKNVQNINTTSVALYLAFILALPIIYGHIITLLLPICIYFLTSLLTFFIIGDIIGLKESAQAP